MQNPQPSHAENAARTCDVERWALKYWKYFIAVVGYGAFLGKIRYNDSKN